MAAAVATLPCVCFGTGRLAPSKLLKIAMRLCPYDPPPADIERPDVAGVNV